MGGEYHESMSITLPLSTGTSESFVPLAQDRPSCRENRGMETGVVKSFREHSKIWLDGIADMVSVRPTTDIYCETNHQQLPAPTTPRVHLYS